MIDAAAEANPIRRRRLRGEDKSAIFAISRWGSGVLRVRREVPSN
jgi:hypothetical protein